MVFFYPALFSFIISSLQRVLAVYELQRCIDIGLAPLGRKFPFGAVSFTRHTRLGWEFHDRFHTHVRLGDAWVLVTPARNWIFVANAATVTDIFSRGRDFVRPIWMLEALNVFGPNILTARYLQLNNTATSSQVLGRRTRLAETKKTHCHFIQ
ncbi:hypothetical protein EAF00_003638 [Botryotinia globosa]|nr:hypothetical protein EAF00_003638 [Botryotinia globosa]